MSNAPMTAVSVVIILEKQRYFGSNSVASASPGAGGMYSFTSIHWTAKCHSAISAMIARALGT